MSPDRSSDATVQRLERRIADLEARLARLSALHRAAQGTAAAVGVDDVFTALAREMGSGMPRVEEICVMEWDRRRGVVRDVIDYRPWTGRRMAINYDPEYSLDDLPDLLAILRAGSGRLLSMRNSADTSSHQRAYMGQWNWQTLLQLPLVSGGRTLGAIEVVDCRVEEPFERHEIEFCETLAAQAALALQSAQLFERMRHMANHDALTGLANPRTFRRRTAAAVRGSARSGRPLAVLVLDIDDFKHLNDSQGHAYGDRVLRRGAGILRRHARSGDTAGRLGGDELALLLRNTGVESAVQVGERLIAAFDREQVGVTVGISAHPGAFANAGALIDAADRALLEAKADGKRRVRLAA